MASTISIVTLVVGATSIFYSAQIFLLGAEFTWLYAHNHGSRASEAASKDHGSSGSSARVSSMWQAAA